MSGELWSHSEGERPNTVTVYEREPGGPLYARAWDATAANGKGNWRRVSLGHRDKGKAKRYAREQVAKLEKGEQSIADAKLSLGQLFALYEQHRTPKKVPQHQKEDLRRIEMFTRFLGNIEPYSLTLRQWESFIGARSSGAIDPRGNAVPEKKRRPVRARPVEMDCKWFKAVFNWASKWKLDNGRYLMRENPARGYDAPVEKNPRRPVATRDRFDALRQVTDSHTMYVGGRGTRVRARSYLSELLDIADGTGRRINAICSLRADDLRLERKPSRPFGAICWSEDTDKMGYQTEVPISAQVRGAIDRVLADRPAVGCVPLFPSPENKDEPISTRLANKWLVEAEKMAKLEKQKGGLWHPYRRGWATSRKHLPSADVAASGGWKSTDTLKLYQQVDEATMLSVVLSATELRDVKCVLDAQIR